MLLVVLCKGKYVLRRDLPGHVRQQFIGFVGKAFSNVVRNCSDLLNLGCKNYR